MLKLLNYIYTEINAIPEAKDSDKAVQFAHAIVNCCAFLSGASFLLVSVVLKDFWYVIFACCLFGIGWFSLQLQRLSAVYLSAFTIPTIIGYVWIERGFANSLELSGGIIWMFVAIFVAANWTSVWRTLIVFTIQLIAIFIIGRSGNSITPFSEFFIRPMSLLFLSSLFIALPVFNFRRSRGKEKETYQRLIESERNYRLLFERLPIGIYRSSIEGKQLQANPALVKLNGYNTQEEMLTAVKDIAKEWYVDPTRRAEFSTALKKDGVVSQFESEIYRHKTRERIWISETAYQIHDEDGKPQFYAGTVQEITARKRAQQQVTEVATQLRLVTDNIPAWISIINKNYEFEFANQFFETRLGYSPDWLIGKTVKQMFGENNWQYLSRKFEQVFAGETVKIESELKLPNGKEFYVSNVLVPNVVNGNVIGCFSLGLDLTQQHQAEVTLRQMKKVESLGLVASGVAHDFNNLLTGIMAQSSLATRKMEPGHPSQKHLNRAVQASKTAARLVKQLLAYTGDDHISVDEVDLNALILSTIPLIKTDNATIQITTDLSSTLNTIRADAAKVEQIILNLIINSLQAIDHENGEIHVTTQTQTLGPDALDYTRFTGIPLEQGTYTVLSITDNGGGIPAKKLLQIFDPFYTTKFSGHGLGLAAVLGNMRAHNGGVSVDSQIGAGTSFKLAFPIY